MTYCAISEYTSSFSVRPVVIIEPWLAKANRWTCKDILKVSPVRLY